VIEAQALEKRFGEVTAVNGVSLAVAQGEIFGLVGPDGAGKTTTFRLLMGLMRPDAGRIRLAGVGWGSEPGASAGSPREARASVGYVAQQFTLYPDLSVLENVQFTARVRNVPGRVVRQRTPELLVLTGLAPFPDRLARDLSGGMKRKLALACALVHRPRILLLDEPTTGVDPVSRREFWEMLYALPAEGVTLMVSTPYLDEAERCHRLAFMGSGRVLGLDSPAGLLGRMPDALLEIESPDRIAARSALRRRPEVRRVDSLGGALRVAVDGSARELQDGRVLRQWLTEQGVCTLRCEPVAATLSDVFSALSEGPAQGAPP
jgi:ABC-2 type transport system ATP-binding protein